MKKQTSLQITALLTATLLVGCASTPPLEPGAQKVKVVVEGKVVKGCQLRGQVAVSKDDIYGPSHQTVQSEQIDILRNQAARLGANVISLTNHKTAYYSHPEYIISEGKSQRELGAHAMSGKAYSCPQNAVNRLSPQSSNISDVRPEDE